MTRSLKIYCLSILIAQRLSLAAARRLWWRGRWRPWCPRRAAAGGLSTSLPARTRSGCRTTSSASPACARVTRLLTVSYRVCSFYPAVPGDGRSFKSWHGLYSFSEMKARFISHWGSNYSILDSNNATFIHTITSINISFREIKKEVDVPKWEMNKSSIV